MYINPLVVLGLYIGSDGVINLPITKGNFISKKALYEEGRRLLNEIPGDVLTS